MFWQAIKYYWQNREEMTVSLNALYRSVGITRQAVHQRLNRELEHKLHEHQLLYLIDEVRQNHPTMGSRDMYYLIAPEFIGRDKFEEFCKIHGYASKRSRNRRRTTDSTGVKRFPNLTINLELNHLNQLWVSDITYFEIRGKFYYITFVMDAYSRRILGHKVSSRLFTERTTLPALEMAIHTRKGMDLTGLIFHSDGGGQYYDDEFLKKTAALNIKNSMCEYPWDNGKAERINGVIKNNYLAHWGIGSLRELEQGVDRAVELYNHQKPHIKLKRFSPITFENLYIANGKQPTVRNRRRNKISRTQGSTSPAGLGKQPPAQI